MVLNAFAASRSSRGPSGSTRVSSSPAPSRRAEPDSSRVARTTRLPSRSANRIEPATSTIASPPSTNQAVHTPRVSSASGTKTSTMTVRPSVSTVG